MCQYFQVLHIVVCFNIMNYTKVTFRTEECEEYTADLLAAELAEIGFESFEETGRGIIGYCPTSVFTENAMKAIIGNLEIENPAKIKYNISKVADQNWNAVWEQNGYEPIEIGNRCIIHASGKTVEKRYKYDLIIDPVQSFGSGYHQTTRMILRWILDNNVTGLNVLDMGCGTAVLSILASKCGAKSVTAIDIDQWAWQNAKDNCKTNGITNAEIRLGDATLLAEYGNHFDIVFANINRNILVADMPRYSAAMKSGAKIIMSGYFLSDLDILREGASKCGLQYISRISEEGWTAAMFIKL